jgi:hypothetical protein
MRVYIFTIELETGRTVLQDRWLCVCTLYSGVLKSTLIHTFICGRQRWYPGHRAIQKIIDIHLSANLARPPLGATSGYHLPATEVVIKTGTQTRAVYLKVTPLRRQWLRCARLFKLA